MFERTTNSAEETKALAHRLGHFIPVPVTLALVGDLGAGKTCFVQGLAASFDLNEQPVSPTFVLISEHDGRVPLLHADLYRVDKEDLPGLGIEELLELWHGVSVVEWANLYPEVLPENTIWISLQHIGKGRKITLWSEEKSLINALKGWNENDCK